MKKTYSLAKTVSAAAMIAGVPMGAWTAYAAQDQSAASAPGLRITTTPQTTKITTSSRSQFVFSENGRTVTVEMADGKVERATVNGTEVPSDRVRLDGDRLTILDEHGAVQWERTMSQPFGDHVVGAIPPDVLTLHNRGPGLFASNDDAALAARQAQDEAKTRADAALMPPVMIGIQMAEPEPSLLGHFGLKPGSATMLSAVYDGFAAAKAGLKPYDLIVGIDGSDSASSDELVSMLRNKKAGDRVLLTVLQQGQKKTVTVELEAFDAQKMEQGRLNAPPNELTFILNGESGDVNIDGKMRIMIEELNEPGIKPFIWKMPAASVGAKPQGKMNITMGAGGPRVLMVPPPSMAGMNAAEPDWAALDAAMQARLERMERMMEQLMRQHQSNIVVPLPPMLVPAPPAPSAPITPPAPPQGTTTS